jgi:anaerobic dimethyl sulfoxide reductase subunit C (anchor subunit)
MPHTVLDHLFILGGMIAGLALVYGISRLYMLRTVPAWNNPGTPAAFFTTTFLLGTVAVTTLWILLVFWDDAYAIEMLISRLVDISTTLILLFSGLQLGIFIFQVLYLNSQGGTASDSIRLLWTDLRAILIWRSGFAFLGTGILVTRLVIWLPPPLYFLAFGFILVAEILGRFLFYGFYRREGF